MSAYVTLRTPIIDRECLLTALQVCGYSVTLEGENILTSTGAHHIRFSRTGTGYGASLDEDYSYLLSGIVSEYNTAYSNKLIRLAEELKAAELEARRKAEAERIRMEEERRRLVESQRLAIHEKAKKMGYQIKETREGETLRLVLVKRSY